MSIKLSPSIDSALSFWVLLSADCLSLPLWDLVMRENSKGGQLKMLNETAVASVTSENEEKAQKSEDDKRERRRRAKSRMGRKKGWE
ncbi:hypothetical protein BJ508DRAFT_163434 [Ascobolus immersus RN42]|uniref:Uncharacterized protein n=1 Tax=Ascobolus immersus RN42 TaxID=1160509 RepID=A0A3N4I7N9_ASCIM|nr:hypothetical protein BJ508DRAFT_163434 [Ascobolus immersus RN42]